MRGGLAQRRTEVCRVCNSRPGADNAGNVGGAVAPEFVSLNDGRLIKIKSRPWHMFILEPSIL
ncbi:hypothetical protein EMIT043CA1_40324 [Pseudomonas brassicacearum]